MSDVVVRLASEQNAGDCEPLEDWEILLEVVLALVSKPDQVRVEEKELPDSTYFIIGVAPEDLGKIIGKNGETVSVLRKLFGRIAAGRGRKTFIQILEPGKINKRHRNTSYRRNAAA